MSALPATLPALTGLRAFAALAVAAAHVQSYVAGEVFLIAHGYLGVDLFFILSGFILSHVYGETFRASPWRGYGRYMALRLGRIWPAYAAVLVGLIAMLVIVSHRGEKHLPFIDGEFWRQAALHLAMLQSWGVGGIATDFNTPGWSVSSELIGYLLFPFLAWLLWRLPLVGVGAMLVPAAGLVFLAYTLKSDGLRGAIGAIGSLRMLGEFTAGMVAYRLALRAAPERVPWDGLGWAALAVLLAIAAFGATRSLLDLVIVATCIVLVAAVAHASGSLRGFFSHRWMIWLGEISYGLFLAHYSVMSTIFILSDKADLLGADDSLTRALFMIGALGASILVGAAIYYLVEQPARQWVRHRIGRHP